MAQRPNIKPFDFSTAYSRLGGALADIPKQTVAGFARGKELEFAGKREERADAQEKRSGEAFELDKQIALEKIESIRDKKEQRKAAQKYFLNSVVEDNPKIPAKELSELESYVKTLDYETLKSYGTEYALNRANRKSHKQKYGKTVQTFEPGVKDFAMGGTAEKFQGIRDKGVKAYMDKGLASRAQEYIQANKENPSQEGFLQSLFKDAEGADLVTDENYRKIAKDAFLGELDRYKAQTGRIQARTAGMRAKTAAAGKPLIDKINAERFQYRNKVFDKTRKIINDLSKTNLRNLGDMAQFIHGKEFAKMSEDTQNKLKNAVAEMATHEQVDNILLQAADQGLSKFTTSTAAKIAIDDILDGDGETQDKHKPFEEMVLGIQAKLAPLGDTGTGEPVTTPAPASQTPAPPGGRQLSPLEQQALEWAQANPGPKADQILKKLGMK